MKRRMFCSAKALVVIVLSVTLMWMCVGCAGKGAQQPGTKPAGPEKADDKAAEKTAEKPATEFVETVYVGVSAPLSGGGAKYGANCVDGAKLAVEKINSRGISIAGRKYKIELVSLDDRYLANEAATCARRLIQQYRCPAVFCPHSGGIQAMLEFNEQENFLVLGYTSDPIVEERGNKLLVRIPTPYPWYLGKGGFIDQAMARFGKRAVCVPGVHEYAKNWTNVFISAWKSAGGEVLGNYPVDYTKEADFYTPVSKALAFSPPPDVMFIGGPSEPTAIVIKQARELGFKGGFIAMDQAKENEIERIIPMAQLEGFIGTAAVQDYATTSEYAKAIGRTNEGAVAFLKEWQSAYGDREPTSESSYFYMTTFILARAMELAGTVKDARAIFSKFPAAIDSLPNIEMTRVIEGISDTGGFINLTLGCHVKNGKRDIFVVPAPDSYRSRKVRP